jgi:hypothetical protein
LSANSEGVYSRQANEPPATKSKRKIAIAG